MCVKYETGWRFCECACAPRCTSRPHEGGRAASEVDHHARPLAARWRGWNEASAGGANRRDFPKGLLEGTSRKDFSKGLSERTSQRDFSKGLLEGLGAKPGLHYAKPTQRSLAKGTERLRVAVRYNLVFVCAEPQNGYVKRNVPNTP